MALKAPARQIETPTPIKARDAISRRGLRVAPKTIDPAAASTSIAASVRLAP